jgi:hypothetical protein
VEAAQPIADSAAKMGANSEAAKPQMTELQQRAVKASVDIITRGYRTSAGLSRSGVADFLERISKDLAQMIAHLPGDIKQKVFQQFVEQARWDPKQLKVVRVPLQVDGVTKCLAGCLQILGADVPELSARPERPDNPRFSPRANRGTNNVVQTAVCPLPISNAERFFSASVGEPPVAILQRQGSSRGAAGDRGRAAGSLSRQVSGCTHDVSDVRLYLFCC